MPKIIGHGAPTASTPGTLGQEYFDKDSSTVYTCIKAEHKTEGNGFEGDYEWAIIGGGSEPDLVITANCWPNGADANLDNTYMFDQDKCREVFNKLSSGKPVKIRLDYAVAYGGDINRYMYSLSHYLYAGSYRQLHAFFTGCDGSDSTIYLVHLSLGEDDSGNYIVSFVGRHAFNSVSA